MGDRVLLTRPIQAAQRTAKEIEALGYEPVIVPLITIQATEVKAVNIRSYDVLLVTSANALHVLDKITDERDVAIWAVGDHTAEVAKRLGFKNVQSVSGTVQDLKAKALAAAQHKYLYLAGRHKSFLLKEALRNEGIQCEEYVLYEAVQEHTMPQALLKALTEETLDYALFFSRRTAEVFIKLAEQENCTQYLQSIKALCFSDKVLESVKPELWNCTSVASHPDHDQMMALLGTHC